MFGLSNVFILVVLFSVVIGYGTKDWLNTAVIIGIYIVIRIILNAISNAVKE